MYFYHEHYHDAYAAALDDLRSRETRDGDTAYAPIRIPAVLNWLLAMSAGLLVIVVAIEALG